MPGRNINDHLKTIDLIYDYLEEYNTKEDGVYLLAIDQQKAFDRVNQNYTKKVLDKLGLGINFINWYDIIYIKMQKQK